MSRIIIKIKEKEIMLVLKNKNKIIDKASWQDDRNLSQSLLVEIDKLLQKNYLTAKDIADVRVDTKIDDKFTTVRIAKIVAKTFNEVQY